jgi:GWxTD domain-containing protein
LSESALTMTINKYLLTISILALPFLGWAIDLTKVNLSHQINPKADMQLISRVVETDGDFLVYLETSFGSNLTKDNVKVDYLVQPNYKSVEDKNIDAFVTSQLISEKNGTYMNVISVPKYISDSVLVIEYTDLSRRSSYIFDIQLLSLFEFPKSSIKPFLNDDAPTIDNYLIVNTPYKNQEITSLYGFYYSYDFPYGQAPMAATQREVGGKFKIDSTFVIPPDGKFTLNKLGLYLLQADTTSDQAIALSVEPAYFPKYRTLEQLITCTRYITTTQEYRVLELKKDKSAFDEMWLNMTGSTDAAIRLIRKYYQRIEEANGYYTSYKSGWKTDQGMIYTIFGTPDALVKGDDFEVWSYVENDYREKITFTFVKIKDVFSRQHFELLRSAEHGSAWLKEIRKWRSGI